MTALANFSHLARGGKLGVPQEHTILPDTDSPGVSITQLFMYQSYFDSTLLQTALLTQAQNEPIVDSTAQRTSLGGYAIGLHPSSQTPVAIRPTVGGQSASPQTIILKPGQIYRPHGRIDGKPGNFSGFTWGLPFGWLGGGVATLYVFPSPDADVAWPGNAEVLYHRQRMLIGGFTLPANAPKNWPLRFPWTQAIRGASSISQQGAAIISITEPTQILMTLRKTSLASPANMRMLFQETNDFGLDSAGAVIAAETVFVDYTWGTYVAGGGGGGNLTLQYPVKQLTGEAVRLAADDGGVQLIDLDSTALAEGLISGAYVDVCRYGKI